MDHYSLAQAKDPICHQGDIFQDLSAPLTCRRSRSIRKAATNYELLIYHRDDLYQFSASAQLLGWALEHRKDESPGQVVLSQLVQTMALLALGLAGASASETEAPSLGRQQELLYLLHQDCGSCHGMTLKGGLGPSLLATTLAGKPADYLRHVITSGVAQTAMPPWGHLLDPVEIDFLVERLTQPEGKQGINP